MLGHDPDRRASVPDVYETLLRRRKVAYTSLITMMKILEQKGASQERANGAGFPVSLRQATPAGVERHGEDFVDRVFRGATKPPLVHLVEDKRLSSEDLEEIRRLLRKSS
jgi:predicted transcriptional regulator